MGLLSISLDFSRLRSIALDSVSIGFISFLVGTLSKVPNIEMKRGIEKLGGLCQGRVEEDSAACFATQETLEEMGTEIKRARKFDVQVPSSS